MVVSEAKSNNEGGNGGWGLGLFFIFFHNHNQHLSSSSSSSHHHQQQLVQPFNNKRPLTERPSYSPISSSTSNLLVSKTQSTLSICGLLLFTTLLLFTLSSFEPSSSSPSFSSHAFRPLSRRLLRDKGDPRGFSISRLLRSRYKRTDTHFGNVKALQGLGELYLRGSKPMSDIIVAHVSENASVNVIRSFIRLLMHSGLLSRTDLVLLFPSPSVASKFGPLLKSECNSLLRIIHLGMQFNPGEFEHGLTRYFRVVGEGEKEPLWGRRAGGANLTMSVGESSRPSYGSVVGFDASELDPEDSLSGFLDNVPMSLRRWACYPMLLGRVRRTFKHMMLVDAANSLILSDPFARVRNRSSETVSLWSNSNLVVGIESNRHGRRNAAKSHNPEQNRLSPEVIVGGSRGVRRFANAALTEIVRGSIEHKGKNKNSVTEAGLVNQLVHSRHLLKNINLITPTDSILDSSSLAGFDSGDSNLKFLRLSDNYSVVQRGSFDVDETVIREICLSHKLYSSVYNDCLSR